MSTWPLEKIGAVLEKSEAWIEVQPEKEYNEVTVRLWGKGVNLRGVKLGSEIGSSRRLSVSKGQFIISRIDARHGACGLIPESLDGAIVTNDFPVYTPKKGKILPRYLELISKTNFFVDACKRASEGTTNRVRLKEPQFYEIEIPLPDIQIQKEVVAKIDLALEKLEKVKLLRVALLDDAQAMLQSAFNKITENVIYKPMTEVAPLERRKVELDINMKYPELGVRCFGNGTFHKPILDGMEVGTKKLYQMVPGDLVFSNVFAWEGAIAVVKKEDEGRVGSHRFITCLPKPGITTSNFLCFYFLTKEGLDKIQEASPGGAGRNRTLGLKRLEKIEVPVPDYDQQLWFDQLQNNVDKIRQAQSENEIELEALMPSILDKAFKGELV
ncbi:restriction endonuclease subunit S [Vibrio cyclitrophicus]|uniref:restriction endonuclease subunit S n=1 Tax=Vibrio cyclitrophicus TaxID=47951 RepID=UPI000C824C43|nr:restriction endonuclease subunit S [Vibrio cyclitrophicus]PMH36910.1 restriction endonuclease subunit S [Vibrio cyclitrophicus]